MTFIGKDDFDGKPIEGNKILIIKMTALGDVVITLPHIEAICRYHSHDSIWLLTSEASKSIFLYHPALKIIVLDRDHGFSRNGFWQNLRWIRKQKFNKIYDLQGNRISRILTRFSGSAFRVGTSPHTAYTHAPLQKWIRTTRQNVFDRLNEALTLAGLPAAEKKSHIYLGDNDIAKVNQWIRDHGLSEKQYAVFHAGSSSDKPAKRWPLENYLKLAQMIEGYGLKCIWVGSNPEIEVNTFLSAQAGIDSTGAFNLRQLYEFARRALFAVGNDSCPMHISAAAGIPVYCLFGPANWRWSHPLGQRDRVLTNEVECSPCFRGVCPQDRGHQCLAGITPKAVFDKIDQELHLLKNSRSDWVDA